MNEAKNVQPLRAIWGIAKSEELRLTDEELHMIVFNLTKKDSLKKLSEREARFVIAHLSELKDSARKEARRKSHPSTTGNAATQNQRKKIYKLTEDLGWQNEARVNGMCKRMFKVDCIKWLNYKQCSDLIEALKKMLERQKGEQNERNSV